MDIKKILQIIAGSNLQNKIVLLFILIATIPILVLGGLAVYLIDFSHRFDVSNLELQLIDQKTEEIKKFFADTAGVLELQVGFSQKTPIGLNEQRFILDGIIALNRAFEEVSFIDVGGLIANDIPTKPGLETIKLFRGGDNDSELFDISNLEKYQSPLSGKTYFSEVYQTLNGPMITISSPVKNRNGDIIQILSAEVNMNQISRSIINSTLGFSGGLTLLDGAGSVIASKNKFVSSGANLANILRIRQMLDGKTFDGLGNEDRYQSVVDGAAVVGAGKKIPSLGWVLFAEWPLDDADSVIRDVRNQVFAFTLISILAVLAIAPFFALRIIRPIRQLELGSSKIEEGDFEYKVDIKSKDELEQLGNAFNKMGNGLKRLQELKNEFVFIAAHELRTPVTAIKGYMSMLFEGDAGPVPEAIKKFLEPVGQANDRLVGLINDILEIARSEAGRIKIEVFSVDIRASIKGVIQNIAPLAVERKIAINYAIGENEPIGLLLVLADTMRLHEVITNFISNAIKYDQEGGWIKIYHETDADFVTTHIEDNGIGIPKSEQGKIFEKFFRSDASKVAQIQGTGLGLFITKELVEKMGGKVWFQSPASARATAGKEEGRGTRFSFKLPRPKNKI
ncbi:MAG: sensor histidine kinase [Patescibacteria group bacterium]